MKKNLADIAVDDFQKLLDGKGPTSARMHQANLRGFWRWASKRPRSWTKVEIIEALEIAHSSNDNDIVILRAEEVRALLNAAEQEEHAAAGAYAIAVSGGGRTGGGRNGVD